MHRTIGWKDCLTQLQLHTQQIETSSAIVCRQNVSHRRTYEQCEFIVGDYVEADVHVGVHQIFDAQLLHDLRCKL